VVYVLCHNFPNDDVSDHRNLFHWAAHSKGDLLKTSAIVWCVAARFEDQETKEVDDMKADRNTMSNADAEKSVLSITSGSAH
jgi:hypothetical protein